MHDFDENMPFGLWQLTPYFGVEANSSLRTDSLAGFTQTRGMNMRTTERLDRRRVLLGGLSTGVLFMSKRTRAMSAEPKRYKIAVPESTLARIRERIRHVHTPRTSQGAGWQYGLDADWFNALVAYWRDDFDWLHNEHELNLTPQYSVTVQGVPIHFAWIKPEAKKHSVPFVLLHGWPYTFASMLPLANSLAKAGFEVVVPSLPGYGFSPAPDNEIRGLRFIGGRISAFLQAVGFNKYLIHGGDHGAVIADWLAIDVPDHVVGIHTNTIGFRHAGAEFGTGQTGAADATEEEKTYVRAEVERMDRESAYFRLQFTRPETITYALADSPVGWAAYMLDKWQKWTSGGPDEFIKAYPRDRLLTEVMIYLVTDTVATAMWPYAGFRLEPFGLQPGQTLDQPFGYSSFDDPLLPRMPRRFVERSRPHIKLWREHEKGGHFPMLTATETLAADIIDFAKQLG
jgi:pimeloyl-ACP methyl ester carboxylesterase